MVEATEDRIDRIAVADADVAAFCRAAAAHLASSEYGYNSGVAVSYYEAIAANGGKPYRPGSPAEMETGLLRGLVVAGLVAVLARRQKGATPCPDSP